MPPDYSQQALKLHSKQLRLFEHSRPIANDDDTTIEKRPFYTAGFQRFENIPTLTSAAQFLDQFIRELDFVQLPHLMSYRDRIQLAKLDKIPVCEPIVQTNFQAMHFDMGLPFASTLPQDLYLLVALYTPLDSKLDEAKTRVVSLSKLLSQKNWPDFFEIEKKLLAYVSQYGDGWEASEAYTAQNTQRLSLFARVLDALNKSPQLTHYRDSTTGDWFKTHPADPEGLGQERAYYRACGLDLESVEEHFLAEPGSLLIIDNFRCIHGRMGHRERSSFYQFMYGVPQATPLEIVQLRHIFIQMMAPAVGP